MAQFGTNLPAPYDQRFLDALTWLLNRHGSPLNPVVADQSAANRWIRDQIRDFVREVERMQDLEGAANRLPVDIP